VPSEHKPIASSFDEQCSGEGHPLPPLPRQPSTHLAWSQTFLLRGPPQSASLLHSGSHVHVAREHDVRHVFSGTTDARLGPSGTHAPPVRAPHLPSVLQLLSEQSEGMTHGEPGGAPHTHQP